MIYGLSNRGNSDELEILSFFSNVILLYSCATVDKISTDIERRAVSLWYPSFLLTDATDANQNRSAHGRRRSTSPAQCRAIYYYDALLQCGCNRHVTSSGVSTGGRETCLPDFSPGAVMQKSAHFLTHYKPKSRLTSLCV